MNLPMTYAEFLDAKMVFAPVAGFIVTDDEINPLLKPHQKAIVKWAILGGRRAIFAAFAWARVSCRSRSFVSCWPARRHGADLRPSRGTSRILPRSTPWRPATIPISLMHSVPSLPQWQAGHPDRVPRLKFIRSRARPNRASRYHQLRDASATASSTLACSGRQPRRGERAARLWRYEDLPEFMRLFDGIGVQLRRHGDAIAEPVHRAARLRGLPRRHGRRPGETRFFKRDSEKADDLTHPPAQGARVLAVGRVAGRLFVQKPTDLGFSTRATSCRRWRFAGTRSPTDHCDAGRERRPGQAVPRRRRIGVVDAAREKRDSLTARIAKMMEIRAATPPRIASSGTTWRPSARHRGARPGRRSASTAARTSRSARRRSSDFSDGEVRILASQAGDARHRVQLPAPLPPGRSSSASASSSTTSSRRSTASSGSADAAGADRHDLHRGRARGAARRSRRKWAQHDELVDRDDDGDHPRVRPEPKPRWHGGSCSGRWACDRVEASRRRLAARQQRLRRGGAAHGSRQRRPDRDHRSRSPPNTSTRRATTTSATPTTTSTSGRRWTS